METLWQDPNFRVNFIFCVGGLWLPLIGLIIYINKDCNKHEARGYGPNYNGQATMRDGKERGGFDSAKGPEYVHITIDVIEKMTLEQMLAVPQDQVDRLPKDMKMIFARELNRAKFAERQKQINKTH
jgi:hypothetical protein